MFERVKTFFKERGEGTAWDLDYGKLIIIGLCIYIAINIQEIYNGFIRQQKKN